MNAGWRFWFFAPAAGTSLRPPRMVRRVNAAMAVAILALVLIFSFPQVDYHWAWGPVWMYRTRFVEGWLTTVGISLASLVLSTVIGLVTAAARRSPFLPFQYLSRLYVEVIRGTPLLVQILILFYVVGDALHLDNRYVVGVLTLSFFSGAYISEIIRSGIESIGRSQIESAQAIGLTRRQIYQLVIFPQAFRHVLPPLAGEFASLIKNSSLLSVIAINEFTLSAEQVNANTYSTLESYLPLAFGYLILTLSISIWSRWLEEKYRYET